MGQVGFAQYRRKRLAHFKGRPVPVVDANLAEGHIQSRNLYQPKQPLLDCRMQ